MNRMQSVLNGLKKEILFDLPKESGITMFPAKDSIEIKKNRGKALCSY